MSKTRQPREEDYDSIKIIGGFICLLIFLFFMWLGTAREYISFNKARKESRVIYHTNYVPVVTYEIILKSD